MTPWQGQWTDWETKRGQWDNLEVNRNEELPTLLIWRDRWRRWHEWSLGEHCPVGAGTTAAYRCRSWGRRGACVLLETCQSSHRTGKEKAPGFSLPPTFQSPAPDSCWPNQHLKADALEAWEAASCRDSAEQSRGQGWDLRADPIKRESSHSTEWGWTALCASWSGSCVWLLQPQALQPTRLLCPWDSPGRNTAVGFRFLLGKTGLVKSLFWSDTVAFWDFRPQACSPLKSHEGFYRR